MVLRKCVLYLLLLLLPILAIEIGLRILFSVKVDPNILFFGTGLFRRELQKQFDPRGYALRENREERTDVMWHDYYLKNYSKYYPGEERTDFDQNGDKFIIKINSNGFRGADCRLAKEPGVIRIVTLGASSTFGYRNKDDETYPFYLQEILNEKLFKKPDNKIKRFEVINLGIPHLRAENIYSLFMNEGLPLNPDIVTFYEGANDVDLDQFSLTRRLMYHKYLNILPVIYIELRQRSILLCLSAELINNLLIKYKSRDLKKLDENQQPPMDQKSTARLDDVENNVKEKNQASINSFIRWLEEINKECRQRHILFLVGTQQASSFTFSRDQLKGVTYDDEVNYIRSKLTNNEEITRHQLYLLGHAQLMKELKFWAYKNNVLYVDTLKALDQNRNTLISWVHLSPAGNRLIATELAGVIYNALIVNLKSQQSNSKDLR